MRTDDPNTTPDTTTPDPAAAAAEPVLDTETELATAMDAGIEAASEPAPEPAVEPTVDPVPGSPEALAAEQAATEAAAAKTAAEPAPDAELETEIAGLNLKGKANERFREMASELKALAPLKAELEKAGIKDVAELPGLVKNAKDGADLVAMVQDTGTTPDQFGQTLDYLTLIAKVSTGDREAGEQAWAMWMREGQELAKGLGKEMPGIHDPLAEHADLTEEIEKGDLTRARALEIAGQRTQAALAKTVRERATATEQATTAEQTALVQGRDSLNALEGELMAADPQYAAKRPALLAKVVEIRTQFPPAQWAAAAKLAYAAIQVAAPAAKTVLPGPIRPGGHRPAVVPAVFDNPDDAMDAGIAAASA